MTTRMTALTVLAAAAMVTAIPAPALADSAYGCTFPGGLPKEELLSRSWDAKGLVMFIKREGSLEVKSRYPDPLLLKPVVELRGSDGRERVLTSEGKTVKLAADRHSMSEAIINGVFFDVERALDRLFPGGHFIVRSVETLEHDARLRTPLKPAEFASGNQYALTLEFINAKPQEGDGVNSHKLVLFLSAIGETEKNLRR